MSSLLDTARWYVANGFSVIPVKADGSKAPLAAGWRKYTETPPDDATLVDWFGPGQKRLVGIGIPPGPASGNMVVLDFECHKENSYFEWLKRLPARLADLARAIPTVITPSGGRHLWVRLADPQPGGVLARYAGRRTKIEIRGEGHQVLAPGCPAECHATGRLYEWASPPPDAPGGWPVLEAGVWAELCEHAAACNEHLPPEQPRDRDARAGAPAGPDSPGNDFNARGSWAETGLFDAGWSWAREVSPDRGFLTRPGKGKGISASVGMVTSKESGYPYLYVWSTSTDLPTETPMSRFAVFAALKHAGDFSAAARELARLGYGERLDHRDRPAPGGPAPAAADAPVVLDLSEFAMKLATPDGRPYHPFPRPPAPPPADAPAAKDENRPFKWMGELTAKSEEAKWVWAGFLARGGITLLSALWKAGKSTLLSHLLKALDGSKAEFLGGAVAPARVLYVTEEPEHLWATRRDALGIGNHVGMWVQPFRARPTVAEWRKHLADVCDLVDRYQFDAVVYDTLSKIWPVRDENDAGQVEEALMPLWTVAAKDVAVLLVHHTRKSGGTEFTGSRGSGGLPAFCEILVEFGRASDGPRETKRVLRSAGRYQETPPKLLIELTPAGYISHGDPDDSQVRAAVPASWQDHVRAVLDAQGPEWATFSQIQAKLSERQGGEGVRKADLLAHLGHLFDRGEVERTGGGKNHHDPYKYRITHIDTQSESDPTGSDPMHE